MNFVVGVAHLRQGDLNQTSSFRRKCATLLMLQDNCLDVSLTRGWGKENQSSLTLAGQGIGGQKVFLAWY